MATRRSRIKVVANIPMRRKNSEQPTEGDDKSDDVKHKEESVQEAPQPVEEKKENVLESEKPQIVKRKLLSPLIVSKDVVKKSKVEAELETGENTNKLKPPNTIDKQSELITQITSTITTRSEENLIETTLDEVTIPQSPILSPGCYVPSYKIPRDIDYPPPPPSPNILNRIRKKAVPRLGIRKTSLSASESEDETRKSGTRIRNDSICSAVSGSIPDPAQEIATTTVQSKPREINSVIQKKCNRTEQTRKLAEAKIEFQKRFGDDKPDRQKLTMMDLIFYNPSSNPIVQSDSKPKKIDERKESEEEKVDDPVVVEEKSGDEENEMPVPQIKLGPDGEIIVDEKSLVIENKDLKKQKQKIQNTEIIDGDNETSYGLYKRQKRGKNWSQSETIRFYKALNVLGSDFSMMLDLFPDRTRRQLKMKFKKEEKINKHLIDKALTQPNNFSYTDLLGEMEREERMKKNEAELFDKLQKEKADMKKKNKSKGKKLAENDKKGQEELDLANLPMVFAPEMKRKQKCKKQKKDFDHDDFCDADISDSDTQSESEQDEEIVQINLKPTRYGRIPKVVKKLNEDQNKTNNSKTVKESSENNSGTQKDLETSGSSLKPGSVMMLCQQQPNEMPIYKFFMVTPKEGDGVIQTGTGGVPVQSLFTITAKKVGEDKQEEQIEENNVTIPADETVTSLRSNNPSVSKEGNFKSKLKERFLNICKDKSGNCSEDI